MSTDFLLQFDRNPAIYYAGENVTGVITTDKAIGLTVELMGRVKSYFHTGNTHGEEISILVAKEVKFPNEGADMKGKQLHFKFLLPPHLPATFTTKKDGSVEYYLEVEVFKGFLGAVLKALQKKNKFPFEVRSSICLSLIRLWKDKVAVEKEKNVNYFGSGIAGYKFQLFKRELVAGEPVQFRGLFYNNSKFQMNAKLSLIQMIIVGSCKERTSLTRKDLQHLKGPKVGPGETKVWDWFDETQTQLPQLCIPKDTFISENSDNFLVVNSVWVQMNIKRRLYTSRYLDRIYIKIGATQTNYSPEGDWLVIHQALTDPCVRKDERIKWLKLK